jgi:hypothetical protein
MWASVAKRYGRGSAARNARSQDRSTGADGTKADELVQLRAKNARLRVPAGAPRGLSADRASFADDGGHPNA